MKFSRPNLLRGCASLLLLLGVFLLDRTFSTWRDDGRNFPNANGVYLPPEKGTPQQTFLERRSGLEGTGAAGLGMVIVSVLLFSKEPF